MPEHQLTAQTAALAAACRQIVVFTDLDGTLLDHDGYSFAGAADTLARLQQLAIPLIFATSKTRAEVEALQKTLQLDEPFIVENGGGLFFPPRFAPLHWPALKAAGRYQLLRFGATYADIRHFFGTVRAAFQLKGFGDMESAEIMARTGLSHDQANLARQREFTEPFVFLGEEKPVPLAELAAKAGFALTKGGRFYHLMGRLQDKGRAIRETLAILKANNRPSAYSIGLGDSANDLPLLAAVDQPVLIPHPDGSHEPCDIPNLQRAALPGSRGWGMAVDRLLETLTIPASASQG